MKSQQENDLFKENLAIDNNIRYIIINCTESDMGFIRNNIMNSKLSREFNLEDIDWLKCHEYACKTLVKTVCGLWNEGIKSTKDIATKLNLSTTTISVYLKQGNDLEWCYYDPIQSRINSVKGKKFHYREIVQLSKGNEFIKEWGCIAEATRETGICNRDISSVCRGKRKSAGGFLWMYKEDYELNKNNLKSYERKTVAKAVVQLDLNGQFIREFSSASKASQLLGIKTSEISSVCHNKKRTVGKFNWMFKSDYEKLQVW